MSVKEIRRCAGKTEDVWMLKTWDGIRTGQREQLSASTTVCIADNDVGFGPNKRLWFYLVQTLTRPVRASLRGKYHVHLHGKRWPALEA
jgi:hypothetical protein